MSSVAIHPPKTPVTKGSQGTAKATLPNICKMPGPPAPFVPSPLPNIAKSAISPKGYSTTVTVEGNTVAIRGASFESMGDMASKATGGGLLSANTHGPAKFITPGSLTVKIEGRSVHLLGEPMLNNCGPSGSPPNTGATMMGVRQADKAASPNNEKDIRCAIHECDNKKYDVSNEKGDKCAALGRMKHECVKKHRKIKGKEPDICSEQYCDMTSKPPSPLTSSKTGNAIRNFFHARAKIGKTTGYQQGMLRRPDFIYKDKNGNRVVADAKFPCPKIKQGKYSMPSPSDGRSMLTGQQEVDYSLIQGNGQPAQEIQPSDCSADDCK